MPTRRWYPRMVSRLVVRASLFAVLVVVTVGAAAGWGGSSTRASGYVGYHEPSQGWTANVPLGWTAVATGPEFVRNDPLADPTRLYIQTYRDSTPAAALRRLAALAGFVMTAPQGQRVDRALEWQRYRGLVKNQPGVAVEAATARDGANAEVAALVARRSELAGLIQTALLPALDSFKPGAPEAPVSVLASAPPDTSYWPTNGWRTASPSSQGMDAKQLAAMVAEIRDAKIPIDSVTVIRHGYVVLDQSFGRFATGSLGEPYASGDLHELQSATKSVTSMLLGIGLHQNASSGLTVNTPVWRLAAAVHSVPANLDPRKRAMTLKDLLTMQSGLAWKETGYAYKPGSGSDVMAMFATNNWTKYTIDRPMATEPGTTFNYNSGGAHLVSGAVTILTHKTAAAYAAQRLFAPLGIAKYKWLVAPEGINAGGFGLELQPRDLAKLAFLYLHHGSWDGRQIVPVSWVEQSTTDQVTDPLYDYGYLWWLDRADGYAFMAGLYGQLAAVVPDKDLVVVITAHVPATTDTNAVTRWLLQHYILPATH
jgi:CubicO group peptidase (beta-lactamase class C family)